MLFSDVQIETTYGAALFGSDTSEPFVTAWEIEVLKDTHNKVAINTALTLKEVEHLFFMLSATPHLGNISIQIIRR